MKIMVSGKTLSQSPPSAPANPLVSVDTVTISLFIILCVIQVHMDGVFILKFFKSWPMQSKMAINLLHAIGLIAAISLAYAGLTYPRFHWSWAIPAQTLVKGMQVIPFFALPAILALHITSKTFYVSIGYTFDIRILIVCALASLIPLLGVYFYCTTKKYFSPPLFLLAILANSIILKIAPIKIFPLTSKRSDALPSLKAACLSLLQWDHPYQHYLLDNGIWTANVRFPGIMFAYLPMVALDMDMRWATLIFEMTVFGSLIFIFFRGRAFPSHEWMATTAVLAAFILLPYWHFRHELYEMPFWFVLLFSLFFLQKGRIFVFAMSLGLLMATHQWGILFAPFMLVVLAHQRGWKTAALTCAVSLAVAGAIFFAVVGFHFREFYENIVVTYSQILSEGRLYPFSMYFTLYIDQYGLASWLMPIQFLLQMVLLAITLRSIRSVDRLCGILALSLTLQLLFNTVCWTYQYFLVVFLIILAILFRGIEKNTHLAMSG